MRLLIEEIQNEKQWHKKCRLISAFHLEKQSLKDNKRGIKWTVKNTAQLLNLSIGYVSESLKLAKELKEIKELDKMTRDNALILIRNRKS